MGKVAPDFGEQFARITALLEDMHSLAVEGQGHHLTVGEVLSLRDSLLCSSWRLSALLKAISADV